MILIILINYRALLFTWIRVYQLSNRLYSSRETSRTGGKTPACQCKRHKRCGFNPWVRKIPWRRKWQPNPVLLPGKFRGQRSLVSYRPWGCKEWDMAEQLSTQEAKTPSLKYSKKEFLPNSFRLQRYGK